MVEEFALLSSGEVMEDDWCDLDPECNSGGVSYNDSNGSASIPANYTRACAIPFCPRILSYTIEDTNVRVYDLVLLFFSVVFLLFLLIRLLPTLKKLDGSLPLFRLFYCLIFLIPIVSGIYEVLSLCTSYQGNLSKLTHVLLRGAILMTELCVVIFGLFIKLCGNSSSRLLASVAAIASITILFTVAEGILEFFNPHHLPCENYKFFTHGGMIFFSSTSILFAVFYATIFLVFVLGLYRRFNLPSKKSFYRYALFLAVVNVVQAVGSFLWFTGKHRPATGNAGICITLVTNAIYVSTFAPVVYWIFLSNYFRMNSALKSVPNDNTNINVGRGEDEVSSVSRKLRGNSAISNPLSIGKKQNLFGDKQFLMDNSYGSSSSYNSMDEEPFVRKETPEDFK